MTFFPELERANIPQLPLTVPIGLRTLRVSPKDESDKDFDYLGYLRANVNLNYIVIDENMSSYSIKRNPQLSWDTAPTRLALNLSVIASSFELLKLIEGEEAC